MQKSDPGIFSSVITRKNLRSREQRAPLFRAVGGLGNRGLLHIEGVAGC